MASVVAVKCGHVAKSNFYFKINTLQQYFPQHTDSLCQPWQLKFISKS